MNSLACMADFLCLLQCDGLVVLLGTTPAAYTIHTITANEVKIVQGIKGLASGVFFENLGSSFLEVRMGRFSSVAAFLIQRARCLSVCAM